MRLRALKPADVRGLAKRLGRTLVKRGKHPMWESDLPGRWALSIPDHGKDLATGTQRSILNHLEDDLVAWEEKLESDENDGDGAH